MQEASKRSGTKIRKLTLIKLDRNGVEKLMPERQRVTTVPGTLLKCCLQRSQSVGGQASAWSQKLAISYTVSVFKYARWHTPCSIRYVRHSCYFV